MGEIPDSPVADVFDELPLPYIEIDTQGVVVRANRATLALHPSERGELVGQIAFDLMAQDEKEPSFADFVALLESGQKPEPVLRSLYDRSRQFRTYEIHRSLIYDAQGKPQGMRMLCVDVTKTKKQLEAAQHAQDWLESILGSMAGAIIVTDALGFIRNINPATEALLGWTSSEMVGKTIEQGMPMLSFTSGQNKKLDFTMQLERPIKGVATVLTRERKELRVEISTAPIIDKQAGYTTGVVSVLLPLEAA